ncbi:6-phosphogluconolactonase [Chelatococcus reniformis]|uniref:6-phosphogluconolactonase n=1 Tax=Chelatococcus reniformis TaxID=1494448 RepID=A0A916X8H9_9HYPH|nr:6-phosphogluconolactonase [Chelatococcus reniformis]GGC54354.1 6-phosphogluconolactonase [Chelatococcus reniformis]
MTTIETIVSKDAEALRQSAASWLLEEIEATPGDVFVCLSGGSTPQKLYEALARPPFLETLPWGRIRWFFGDDRFVPPSDERSNARMARLALFDHAPIPPDRIHVIPNLETPEASARAYEATLQQLYGAEILDPNRPLFHVMICGIGLDGHTASLFPGKPALAEETRWVVGVPEAGQTPYVPRVTLTLPALNSSRSTAFLVAGADKRAILARVLAGEDLPAARVTAQEQLSWLVDRAAHPDDVD